MSCPTPEPSTWRFSLAQLMGIVALAAILFAAFRSDANPLLTMLAMFIILFLTLHIYMIWLPALFTLLFGRRPPRTEIADEPSLEGDARPILVWKPIHGLSYRMEEAESLERGDDAENAAIEEV
jgi:hypothetical protein